MTHVATAFAHMATLAQTFSDHALRWTHMADSHHPHICLSLAALSGHGGRLRIDNDQDLTVDAPTLRMGSRHEDIEFVGHTRDLLRILSRLQEGVDALAQAFQGLPLFAHTTGPTVALRAMFLEDGHFSTPLSPFRIAIRQHHHSLHDDAAGPALWVRHFLPLRPATLTPLIDATAALPAGAAAYHDTPSSLPGWRISTHPDQGSVYVRARSESDALLFARTCVHLPLNVPGTQIQPTPEQDPM